MTARKRQRNEAPGGNRLQLLGLVIAALVALGSFLTWASQNVEQRQEQHTCIRVRSWLQDQRRGLHTERSIRLSDLQRAFPAEGLDNLRKCYDRAQRDHELTLNPDTGEWVVRP